MGREVTKTIIDAYVVVCVILFPLMFAITLYHVRQNSSHGIYYGDQVQVVDGFFKDRTGTAVNITYGKIMIKFDDGHDHEHIEPRNLKLLKGEE